MILIVADTGPINYLIQIELVDLLARVAQIVLLPESVASELRAPAAPDAVSAWANSLPAWAEVRLTRSAVDAPDIAQADREAIALAKEVHADLLLMDDQHARRYAAKFDVPTMGTLGLLEFSAERGYVSLHEALGRLRNTSCFLSDELIESAVLRDAARRRS